MIAKMFKYKYLMMFSSDGKPAAVCVDVYCVLKAICRFFWIVLLVTIRSIHIVCGSIVFVALVQMITCNLAEGLSCIIPLLGHLEHVCCSSKHLNSIILFTRASAKIFCKLTYNCVINMKWWSSPKQSAKKPRFGWKLLFRILDQRSGLLFIISHGADIILLKHQMSERNLRS